MLKEETLQRISNSVVSTSGDAVETAVRKALEENIGPAEIIEKGLAAGVHETGILFEEGTIFLPHLVLAVDAMEAGLRILETETQEQDRDRRPGTIVNGTVEGDVHDIGKIIVSGMLRASGFTVHDMGRSVPLQDFIDKAKETNADLISLSALTTVSLNRQQELIGMLREQGLRDRFKVMVGGAPASQEWADRIGADCYAKNAAEAVAKARELLLLK
ncbi:cobalamin B12-binding domain-containing protein [Methanolobus chelungpuianus]|uniref:Dimethylamine corrinoid protein 3 n=1 Tax=Methanolobus chelungpuianus TaxID=502115 RepID=A0AAE3HDI9_9EURY|nr:B12-binding domain-containing protein [Methanolobus chelungpuianus]MCQ6963894.1 dimethylamine corrinoid protein 3 [Methanolobus chelungpuianus]